jgi:hypothetical protein
VQKDKACNKSLRQEKNEYFDFNVGKYCFLSYANLVELIIIARSYDFFYES